MCGVARDMSIPTDPDTGEFVRAPNAFDARITADGRDGWPAEAGRYRLVVSRACPWASRGLIVRRLLGLESAIPVAVADPIQDERSWRFTLDPGGRDPVLGIEFLNEAYYAADPGYTGGISVPAVVDVPSGKLVTNDFPRITLDFETEWGAHTRPGAPDLYPEHLRAEIDEINAGVHADVNAAVYEAGFAATQSAYNDAYRPAVQQTRRTVPAAGAAALPGGRHDHRGRHPAVHHAGAVRPRLPRALQVQPAQTRRNAGAVGVRAGLVPDTWVR